MGVRKLKLVVSGDAQVGKTSLLIADYYKAPIQYPAKYTPKVMDSFPRALTVDGEECSVTINDTDRQEDYEHLRKALNYRWADVVLLTFSIGDRESLHSIQTLWLPEAQQCRPGVACLLVGLKADVRTECGSEVCQEKVVSLEEAKGMAHRLGLKYIETSAVTFSGVRECFDYAIRVAIAAAKSRSRGRLHFLARTRSEKDVLIPPVEPPVDPRPEVTVESSTYAEDWHKALQDPQFSDLTFVVGEGKHRLLAHKIIVCSASPFFRKVLGGTNDGFTMQDLNSGRINGISAIYHHHYHHQNDSHHLHHHHYDHHHHHLSDFICWCSDETVNQNESYVDSQCGSGLDSEADKSDTAINTTTSSAATVSASNSTSKNTTVTTNIAATTATSDHSNTTTTTTNNDNISSNTRRNSIITIKSATAENDSTANTNTNTTTISKTTTTTTTVNEERKSANTTFTTTATSIETNTGANTTTATSTTATTSTTTTTTFTTTTTVVLSQDICLSTFQRVLEFLYTGQPRLPEDISEAEIGDVCRVSDMFGLGELTTICCNVMNGDHQELNPSLATFANSQTACNLKDLYLNNSESADVVFNVHGTSVYAHRVVLTTRCDVMAAMFREGHFSEGSQPVAKINIPNSSVDTFLAFLEYLYTDRAPIEQGDGVGILVLADEYCVTRLRSLCELYISKEVVRRCCCGSGGGSGGGGGGGGGGDKIQKCDVDVIGLLNAAERLNAKQLVQQCLHLVSTNYAAFDKRKELSALCQQHQEHVWEHQWPPLWYLQELDDYERKTRAEREQKKCVLM